MGIFDDGYQQAIIDAARQPVDRPPAGFMEGFCASYDTTPARGSFYQRASELSGQGKQRNEKTLEITGNPFTVTANPTDPGLTTVGEGAVIGRAADQRAFQPAPGDQE
jgi:hypothetical protein